MESKKLNEKDKNFHPKFQVHCLDVVSFPKIWRDDVFFFLPQMEFGVHFFSGVVVIDMRELSLAVCSFAFPLTSLCFLQRENAAGIDFCLCLPYPIIVLSRGFVRNLEFYGCCSHAQVQAVGGPAAGNWLLEQQLYCSSCQSSSCCSSCQLFICDKKSRATSQRRWGLDGSCQ